MLLRERVFGCLVCSYNGYSIVEFFFSSVFCYIIKLLFWWYDLMNYKILDMLGCRYRYNEIIKIINFKD